MGLRSWLLLCIGVLYVVSVPWYRESGSLPDVWWGLPDWVAVAIACYAAAAVLNAVLWLSSDLSDEAPPPTTLPGASTASATRGAADRPDTPRSAEREPGP